MVDVNKTLKDVAKKGTIIIGEKQTKSAVIKGNAKMVVIAENCPYAAELSALAKEHNIPMYQHASSGVDLGFVCGKNFAIAAFAVLDAADSNVLQLVKKRK